MRVVSWNVNGIRACDPPPHGGASSYERAALILNPLDPSIETSLTASGAGGREPRSLRRRRCRGVK